MGHSFLLRCSRSSHYCWSHVLLHVQLCVRPLWSADRPEPEYQQIQSRGGGSDGSDVPGHRLDLLGRLLLLPHTEEEIPRRQGILNSSPLIDFFTRKRLK